MSSGGTTTTTTTTTTKTGNKLTIMRRRRKKKQNRPTLTSLLLCEPSVPSYSLFRDSFLARTTIQPLDDDNDEENMTTIHHP